MKSSHRLALLHPPWLSQLALPPSALFLDPFPIPDTDGRRFDLGACRALAARRSIWWTRQSRLEMGFLSVEENIQMDLVDPMNGLLRGKCVLDQSSSCIWRQRESKGSNIWSYNGCWFAIPSRCFQVNSAICVIRKLSAYLEYSGNLQAWNPDGSASRREALQILWSF
ncbi:uncharacterized protein LOC120111866 isoform X2 [Phoenix dactylifera]|uniref:Uncharacterized protein LOC120111866 isoform X2 n=1 Tax=Phoenix dactylifera TaxID=42345 RepID=A0A8B9ARB1_PHODC|nr:uncharacterized protein LOC120111866 isoform X2 [Phoenix dactylifera]